MDPSALNYHKIIFKKKHNVLLKPFAQVALHNQKYTNHTFMKHKQDN